MPSAHLQNEMIPFLTMKHFKCKTALKFCKTNELASFQESRTTVGVLKSSQTGFQSARSFIKVSK